MEKIKAILFKRYYVREVLTLFFIVASLLFLSIYSSFALFEKSVERIGIASISASTLDVSLSKTSINVPAGETVFEDITVTNNSRVSARYKIYTTNTSSDVTVGVASTSENPETGIITSNSELDVRIGIKNDSSKEQTVTFGVQSGYAHNEIELVGGDTLGDVEENTNYVDPSGANSPELADGMIPVIYDETCESTTAADNASGCWEVANTSQAWYSYGDQMWANAVTTSVASYRTASAGTEIPMDDINSMWVWIPRYRYKIPSNIGSSSNVENPPQIDVVFETGTETTGVTETVYRNGIASDGTNTNYYTHPAFRDIDNIEYDSSTSSRGAWDKEITGIWVGKFETGNTADNPLIKPDIIALTFQNVSTQFKTSLKFAGGTFDSDTGAVTFSANANNAYGLNTISSTTDTHMMKNTEWGAVAILSQSQYGKMGNTNYTELNKEVYKNNSSGMYTGRSSGEPSKSGNSTYGTYSYNDKTCGTESVECTGTKVAYSGTGASTTGTIYGVYDMSGGTDEYTMGNWASTTSSSGFTTFPSSKYYDLYNGTNPSGIKKETTILGDATWETMKWYSDSDTFAYTDGPFEIRYWASRGAVSPNDYRAGVFSSGYHTGANLYYYSFRSVLIS